MSSPGQDDGTSPAALFQRVVADPGAARETLPRLLSLLDADTQRTRLSAAWGLTLVVAANNDLAEAATRRLVDRLADGEAESTPEMRAAYRYLLERFPETVSETVSALAADAEAHERRQRYLALTDGFVRNEYYETEVGDRGVGRTRLPGGGSGDSRQLYRAEGNDVGGPPADALADAADDPETGADTETEAGAGEDRRESEVRRRQRREGELARAADAVGLDHIAEASRFEELQLVTTPVEGRYTDVYRTRARSGDTETGIALRVFHTPEADDGSADAEDATDTDAAAFEAAVTDGLETWAAVADHDLVVPLYDWAADPEPWLATAYTTTTLYDRIDLGFEEAVRNGLSVAEAVAAAHERGIVHTGLDPYSVVYTDTVLDDRRKPMVGNFGLYDAVRDYRSPTDLLDPRYAAPEYFDRAYGSVDHATDIYQVGTVLYRLVTGRHPFRGDFETVRTGALEHTPPPPSDINPEIPGWVDDVIRKATAKQKLTRYESVTQLVSELRARIEER